jgi:hypothetical protein
MNGSKLVRQDGQAHVLQLAIANCRKAKNLMRAWRKKLMSNWENETERLIDADMPREP